MTNAIIMAGTYAGVGYLLHSVHPNLLTAMLFYLISTFILKINAYVNQKRREKEMLEALEKAGYVEIGKGMYGLQSKKEDENKGE